MSAIGNILNAFERNNKKLMINSSGSTNDSRLEKIRSGQAYLYQKNGMESEVMEITFNKKISGSFLNNALILTLKRFPYLNTRLVELDGDFYIVQNEMGLVARKTQKLARLGHISCGYHLIDVVYYDKSVFVSWHHALCDGKGIKPFVEALIYYYCKLKYKSTAVNDGIRLADSPLLPDETKEPNLKSYTYDESKAPVPVCRDAYAIPENTVEEHYTDYRYEIIISSDSFMKVCKENGATPVILVSLLASAGIADIYPDFDKPINANVAVDIRDALDLPNTFKNCVRSMPLPYSREFLSMSLSEQSKTQRQLFNAQRDRDLLRQAANSSLKMFDKLDTLEGYEQKQQMMDFFNGMLINTYVISYLGQLTLNENARYIEKAVFYNSGAAGLGITMLSCADKFCLNFKQSFESDKYVKAFLAGLDMLGIKYRASGAIPFVTPKDEIINRKGEIK